MTDVLLRANRTTHPSDDADDTGHDQREPNPLRNCKRLAQNDNGQDRDLQRNEGGIERSRSTARPFRSKYGNRTTPATTNRMAVIPQGVRLVLIPSRTATFQDAQIQTVTKPYSEPRM